MRIYKAFLLNECIILKRTLIWMPLFFLISLGFVIAPYINRYNISGVRYTEDIAGIIAFIGSIFGISMFACISTTQAAAFEKREGMSEFLFSQNICKLSYIFAKLTPPLILAAVGALLPMIIYYGFNLYSINKVGFIPMFVCVFTIVIVWTLISIICARFLNRDGDITLTSMGLTALIAIGLGLLTKPWEYPLWVCVIGAFLVIFIIFAVVYLLLCKEETEIKFEGYE